MALRTMWSGVLEINTLFKLHVSICKGAEEYRGKDALRELCACHHQPFTRQTVCEDGRVRLTDEMRKSGETDNTTEAVKGVLGEDEKYVVLDDAALAAIAAAGTSDAIAVASVTELCDIPTDRFNGLYYLTPDSKVKRSDDAVRVVVAALERDGKALVAKWAPRGREVLVTIYPKDGALVMNTVMYQSEVRAPDAKCLIRTAGIFEEEIEVASQLLDALPSEYDFTAAEDEAVIARQQAIEAARAGEPIPTKEPSSEPEVVPDLMAALQAATKGMPVARAKQAAAKNGKVPAGSAA
ncbi:MAG: Ku protein [Solirubrobacteraceae bacterium]